MTPNTGKLVSVDQKQLVEIDEDNKHNYKYSGNTVVINDVRCATFTDTHGNVFAQPWQVAGIFRKKGEANINAHLKTNDVVDIVKSSIVNGKATKELAMKYNITPAYCRDIINGKAWKHITIALLNQLYNGTHKAAMSKPPAVIATNNPKDKTKISQAIIPFLVKDKIVLKLSTKEIAKKYCLSERQVQRYVARAKCS